MNGVLTNIGQLATCPAAGAAADAGLIPSAALAWDGGRIVWAGRAAQLPGACRDWPAQDAGGRLVIPGLVDCHTHLAFAGWRADEFDQRCHGVTYAEIAAGGGGIARTVQQTRTASEDELYQRARGFLDNMTSLGVTAVECKSGYGLTLDDELKLLRVYRRLRREGPQLVVATFLGAHIVPPTFRRPQYVASLCGEMIPRVAAEQLAVFCDVFVEQGAFSVPEARQILAAARAHGLRPKVHADQLTDMGAAGLAAEIGAISADHLECASDAGLAMMARAGTAAVLLPIASLYLQVPPLDARRCLRGGVRVAVATDFNPGTAPSYHLPLALTLACTLNRLTPHQALRAATVHAAAAIGLEHEIGSLETGRRADCVVLDADSVEHWLYHFRPNAARAVYIAGERVR